jgi:hypothetical protein
MNCWHLGLRCEANSEGIRPCPSRLTSLKTGGSSLPLTAINEALEVPAQIVDRSHAPEIANQIRALKWEAAMPCYAYEIQTARDVA